MAPGSIAVKRCYNKTALHCDRTFTYYIYVPYSERVTTWDDADLLQRIEYIFLVFFQIDLRGLLALMGLKVYPTQVTVDG